MKYIALIISLLFALSLNAQDTWEFKRDKQLHAYTGFSIGTAGTSYFINKGTSYGTAFGLTLFFSSVPITLKEGYDYSRGGEFSIPDIGYGYIGVVQGNITTIGTYSLSEWMLDKKIYGSNDSYSVPWFTATGYVFLVDLGLWAAVPNYRLNPVNIAVQSAIVGANMIIKYFVDKKNGRHKLENFKL